MLCPDQALPPCSALCPADQEAAQGAAGALHGSRAHTQLTFAARRAATLARALAALPELRVLEVGSDIWDGFVHVAAAHRGAIPAADADAGGAAARGSGGELRALTSLKLQSHVKRAHWYGESLTMPMPGLAPVRWMPALVRLELAGAPNLTAGLLGTAAGHAALREVAFTKCKSVTDDVVPAGDPDAGADVLLALKQARGEGLQRLLCWAAHALPQANGTVAQRPSPLNTRSCPRWQRWT